MQAALACSGAGFDYDLKVVDIDADPHLVALYDELVPVLVECATNGVIREVCHHFLDRHALQAALSEDNNLVPNDGSA